MDDFADQLHAAICDLYGLDFAPSVTPAPVNIEADYSTNAPLKLAKELHKPPMAIATELTEKIKNTTATAPGFVNFISSDEYLTARIADLATNFTENISSHEYEGKTVVCEFSDPNPFKVLHVGHLYTSIVGDAISRLYECAGARVIRANFGGDVGLHVAKTIYVLQQQDTAELTIEDIARCYVEGTAAYDTDKHAHEEITALNKEIYRINSEDIHGTPLADLYWRGRELSYQYFKDFYARIGVHFDKFYPESSVAALGCSIVGRELKNGVYKNSNGAVVFPGDRYGLHTRVFINREGVPTYEAKDVGLIFQKYQDYHFDKSIVITGNEQSEYMKVVLKSVEQYAPDLVACTTHLTHGLVKLQGNVKMSSRKGNFLRAVEVLDMVTGALAAEHQSADPQIALAATKYAFIKYKMGGDIVFDPAKSVEMTGNSGPYLLYSAVRARKILEKVESSVSERERVTTLGKDNSKCGRAAAIHNDDKYGRVTGMKGAPHGACEVGEENTRQDPSKIAERTLAKKLLEYKSTLAEALTDLAPHQIATYLYELAQDFSRFYETCPVAGSPEEHRRARLVGVYLNVITHGLSLLGISIPEEM